jgi:hypothetical protein
MILSTKVKIVRNIPFRLDKKDVLRGLGMGSSSSVRPEIDRLIDKTLQDEGVLQLIRPAFVYAVHAINQMESDDCYLEGGTVLRWNHSQGVCPGGSHRCCLRYHRAGD